MTAPDELLGAVRTSTAALVTALQDGSWSDADVRAPSLLPGWSRGHVLTHIARNADGIAVTLEGALRGEDVPRYPHGMAGRNADIEAGSGRSPGALIEDVRTSAARLDAVFARVLAAGPPVLTRTADKNTPLQWLGARWREVEIHHADLGRGYGPQDWPAAFVAHELPPTADTLAQRPGIAPLRTIITAPGSLNPDLVGRVWSTADGASREVAGPDWAVLAWLVGRPSTATAWLTAAPDLPPWR